MTNEIVRIARETSRLLRKNMTKAERILWNELRNRKFLGKRFLRQHPLFCEDEGRQKFFVADFYCHEDHLVIEVDGKSHEHQKEYDEARTLLISTKKIEVIRFKNEQIQQYLPEVLEIMRKFISTASVNSSPGPLP
ncbi:MAG: endonuclease domain-containing protein [Bacteroidota bacterium]|nr:endonuclease domain-containing protein [Bacteroidota bacterium]